MIDSYKLFNCKKVNIISGSNGIEIYNYIFTVFYFLGLLTNVAVVLFANPDLAKLDTYVKFVIFICVENAFIIIIFIFNPNILPNWFNNIHLIKTQFNRMFFNKGYFFNNLDGSELPHHEFVEKKKPAWHDENEANDSDDELFRDEDLFEEEDENENINENKDEEENDEDNFDPNLYEQMKKNNESIIKNERKENDNEIKNENNKNRL